MHRRPHRNHGAGNTRHAPIWFRGMHNIYYNGVKAVLVVIFSFTHGFSPSGFSGLEVGGFSGEEVVGGGDLDQDDGINENIQDDCQDNCVDVLCHEMSQQSQHSSESVGRHARELLKVDSSPLAYSFPGKLGFQE